MNHWPPIVLMLLGGLLGGLLAGAIVWVKMKLGMHLAIAEARRKGVEQSRSTLKGKMAEQMAPMLEGFNYLPSDARFLGDPIDYVVFNGYTAVKDDGAPEEVEVVILDIKHGGAKLTPAQRAIARAVQAGRVRVEVVRISEDGRVVHQI